MKRYLIWLYTFTYCLILFTGRQACANEAEYLYQAEGASYRYTVIETGDNYTFKFDRFLPDNAAKLKAGRHLLRQIYNDDSIAPRYSEHYLRERARCYVFDSRFHTYSLCFLPNDFNRSESERFWGFVVQVPNWKWLATRILAPVLSAFGMLFYLTGRKRKKLVLRID